MPKISTNVRAFAKLAIALVFAKVMFSVVYEYRYYFPLDFEKSDFLVGRRESFSGLYPVVFYAHLVAGPLAIVLGTIQIASGSVLRFQSLHRKIGRLQIIVIVIVGLSGLVMAGKAYAGPVAGLGFATLAFVTMFSGLAAAYYAIQRKYKSHQWWASCCFVMLCSPLLLRIVGGILHVTGFESTWSYQLNAWLSWMIPLVILLLVSNTQAYVWPFKRRWSGEQRYKTELRAIE